MTNKVTKYGFMIMATVLLVLVAVAGIGAADEHPLPDDCIQCYWINTSGAVGIDTGIGYSSVTVEMNASADGPKGSGNGLILGFVNASDPEVFGITGSWFGVSNENYWTIGTGKETTTLADVKAKLNVTFNASTRKTSLTINDVSTGWISHIASYYSLGNLFIGSPGENIITKNVTVYSVKIWNDTTNELIRNMTPVYNVTTEEFGMWDSIEGKFYGDSRNAGGSFGGKLGGHLPDPYEYDFYLEYDDYLEILPIYGDVTIDDPGEASSKKVKAVVNDGVISNYYSDDDDDDCVVELKDGMVHAVGIGDAEISINGNSHKVHVSAADISLMMLAGQSNMAGRYDCDGNMPDALGRTVANEKGSVYASVLADLTVFIGPCLNGVDYAEKHYSGAGVLKEGQENIDVYSFLPGSLGGSYSTVDLHNAITNIQYIPVDMLQEGASNENGYGGYVGIDSALAYQWHELTGDKVWVVKSAYGGSSINAWNNTESLIYQNAVTMFNAANDILDMEIAAGHYTLNKTMVFWCQGCTDNDFNAESYLDRFTSFYNQFMDDLEIDDNNDVYTGLIPTRAGYPNNIGAGQGYYHGVNASLPSGMSVSTSSDYYESFLDLEMTGPRVAQYYMGNNVSEQYEKIYVVAELNNSWAVMHDDGNDKVTAEATAGDRISAYFTDKYGSLDVTYPTQKYTTVTPTAYAMHHTVHYSQFAYNEIGFEAAENMLNILQGTTPESSDDIDVKFLAWDGYTDNEGSSIDIYAKGISNSSDALIVPEVYPRYAAKMVDIEESGNITYGASSATYEVYATGVGEGTLTATYSGAPVGTVNLNVVDYPVWNDVQYVNTTSVGQIVVNFAGDGYLNWTWDIAFNSSNTRSVVGYTSNSGNYFGKKTDNQYELNNGNFISGSDATERNTVYFNRTSEGAELTVDGETITVISSNKPTSSFSIPLTNFEGDGLTIYSIRAVDAATGELVIDLKPVNVTNFGCGGLLDTMTGFVFVGNRACVAGPGIYNYNVTYDGNGNSSGAVPVDVNSPYDVNSVVTVLGNVNDLALPGYNFTGWNMGSTSGDLKKAGDTFTITADTVFYANWTLNSTTSNPDASGNAVFGNDNITALESTAGIVTKVLLDEVSNVSTGTPVTFNADNATLVVPTMDGYTLDEGIAVFEIEANADGTATINVTVTFNDVENATAYEDKIKFVHFNTTNNDWDKNPLTIVNKVNDNAGKVTYTVETDSFSPFGIGIYTAHTYTVKFDANGGQGSMADMPFVYNEAQNLNANTFQRYNSNFVGWLCNGIRYDDKALVNNLTTVDGGSVTMVAQWETYSTGGSSSGTSYLGSSDVSVISTQQPTVAPTAAPTANPTEQPATPTVIATEKPTTQATQSSPAPFVGLIAGLGAAAVLLRLRK